jgi:GxxExxY protein
MNHEGHKGHKGHNEREGEFESPLSSAAEQVVREVIGAGVAVHRALGPGFVELAYERALAVELRCRGLSFERQRPTDIRYRGELVCRHRLDLVVEDVAIVEVKAVKMLRPIHQAQILSYLKASKYRVGLLMNFNVPMLVRGLQRFVR